MESIGKALDIKQSLDLLCSPSDCSFISFNGKLTQRMLLSASSSGWKEVLCWVPEASVQGLFHITISNFDEGVKKIFFRDTKWKNLKR